MKANKTVPTRARVADFLDTLGEEQRRDSKALIALMRKVSGRPPVMWGPSIIGFGSQHYKYESGREGDMPIIGFSPRKGTLALYLTSNPARYAALLKKVGKHKTGVACIYISRLSGVDSKALERLIKETYAESIKS